MNTTMSFDEAVISTLAAEMEVDERIFVMATNPAPQLAARFGPARVRRTPIAESALTGMAVGAAASGLRPVVYWGAATFSFVAFDQIINQAARLRYMSGGQVSLPIVFHARYFNGTRTAAQHTHTAYAFYAHAGGLKIAVPSSVHDARVLMRAALADDNPVIFVQSDLIGAEMGEVGDSEGSGLGVASVVRAGSDVTVVAIGDMVARARLASEALAAEGIDVEIVDPRSLVPLDIDTIAESVARTGRVVVLDESYPTCSMASEIITALTEAPAVFGALRAAPRRVCAWPVPVPFSPPLEDAVLPDVGDVCVAIRSVMDA